MLSDTLVTNEVKDSSGAEVEFSKFSSSDRQKVYAKVGEAPASPYRLSVSHQEIGTGLKRRRRSAVKVDIQSTSGIDSVTQIHTVACAWLDHPVGASSSHAVAANALAHLISFLASSGANTTILYDCTGHGAAAVLNGTL